MSQPDGIARFAAADGLPRDADGPVFEDGWQAEAFALTVRLHEAGCFSWNEWAATLAGVLREVRDRGEVDDGSRYYDHWLVALERLVTAKQVLSASDLDRRKAAWVEAYLSTPHGRPVELPRGPRVNGHIAAAVRRSSTRSAGREPHTLAGHQRPRPPRLD